MEKAVKIVTPEPNVSDLVSLNETFEEGSSYLVLRLDNNPMAVAAALVFISGMGKRGHDTSNMQESLGEAVGEVGIMSALGSLMFATAD